MMSLSVSLQQKDLGAFGPAVIESEDILKTYRSLTIQCLLLGDYLRPSRYTIETLCLHFTVDQRAKVDASIDDWNLIGVIIRLALLKCNQVLLDFPGLGLDVLPKRFVVKIRIEQR